LFRQVKNMDIKGITMEGLQSNYVRRKSIEHSGTGLMARFLAAALIVSLPLSALAQGTLVVLDASDYIDEIEPGAYLDHRDDLLIYPDGFPVWADPGTGPIWGFGVNFACGSSDVADTSLVIDHLGKIRGDETLDGCQLKPRKLITQSPNWTLVVEGSGNLYDIEFKSWRVMGLYMPPECLDNTGGATCASTGGKTSYLRTLVESAPAFSCEGFEAPMDNYPVSSRRGNRPFPLRMRLFDADGFEVTGLDVAAAPVVQVLFSSAPSSEPVDVTSETESRGSASEGNQFVYTDDGPWRYNLALPRGAAAGEYLVTVTSGDDSEYVIEPACMTSISKG
jgi:hypothetical protein